jgi:hypothetical protein
MSDPIVNDTEEPKATDWSDLTSLYARRREKRAAMEQGLIPISSLLPPAAHFAEALTSTSKPNESSSAATGARSLVPKPSSSIGISPSRIDAAMLLPVEQAWQERDSDKLESSLYRSLKPLSRSLRPIVGDSYDLVGYEAIAPLDRASLDALRPLVDRITAPAGREAVVRAAASCLQVTKSRAPDSADLRLMLEAFADDLAEFPADAVATAFRKWQRMEKWWPSLSEIRDHCQRATKWRRSLAKAIA